MRAARAQAALVRATVSVALVAGGVARAAPERVTVLAPLAAEPAAEPLAAALGRALERAARRVSGIQAATAVPADELRAMFGCAEVDVACARRAGEAAGTDAVILSTIGFEADGAVARFSILAVADGVPVRQATWYVHPVSGPATPGLEVALAALALRVVANAAPAVLVLNTAEAPVRVDGASLGPGELRTLRPGLLALEGADARAVELAAGEALLVGGPPSPAASSRTAAGWALAGTGLAAWLATGVMGYQLRSTQRAYGNAETGGALERLADRGGREAAATNALLILGGLCVGVGGVLLWGP